MSETITPKGWADFQHYKDRKPTWIKLHRDLLDNYDFHRLPVASRALAPCLWLLASEYDDGAIPFDCGLIAFRLRMDEGQVIAAVTPLIDKGFFVASGLLAGCKQDACLETETETETETEKQSATPSVADAPPLATGKARKPKAVSQRKPLMTIDEWLADCKAKDEKTMPATDPIFEWAADAGIPVDYLRLAWVVFLRDWKAKKPQQDWRATYRNAVRQNWLKLWYFHADGDCRLTTTGEQERRAHE